MSSGPWHSSILNIVYPPPCRKARFTVSSGPRHPHGTKPSGHHAALLGGASPYAVLVGGEGREGSASRPPGASATSPVRQTVGATRGVSDSSVTISGAREEVPDHCARMAGWRVGGVGEAGDPRGSSQNGLSQNGHGVKKGLSSKKESRTSEKHGPRRSSIHDAPPPPPPVEIPLHSSSPDLSWGAR